MEVGQWDELWNHAAGPQYPGRTAAALYRPAHEAATYSLAASGVLLDAIAWQKPVIARKIPIFEAMFEQHGDSGHLFSDDADVKVLVENLVQATDKSHYRRRVLNLRSMRKSRAPETLAGAYREMCGTSEGVPR